VPPRVRRAVVGIGRHLGQLQQVLGRRAAPQHRAGEGARAGAHDEFG
jgi:hypothetical protein